VSIALGLLLGTMSTLVAVAPPRASGASPVEGHDSRPASALAAKPIVALAETSAIVDAGATTRSREGVVNDNGGWCWFQDERAIFTRDGRLLVSSVTDRDGTDGEVRNGSTEVASYEMGTGRRWVDTVYRGLASDDHNAAALAETASGRVVAMYTDHSREPYIHRAHLDPGDLGWTRDPAIYRPEAAVVDPDLGRSSGVTYSNLVLLSDENGGRGRLYDFFRSRGEHPWFTTSDDEGRTWSAGGELLTRHRSYTRFKGDGHRRVWFITTDGHPTLTEGTSLFAGYLEGGRIRRADGTDLGPLGTPVDPRALTVVARGVPGTSSVEVDHWGADIELDAAGRPVVTYSTRHPGTPVTGRRFIHDYRYARWDGSTFVDSRLSAGGSELYAGQPDYTGLSAVDPADPSRVFVSTDVDPTTGAALVSAADGRVHWEISEGRTTDGGRTWTWSAVTRNSRLDNIRPIIPEPRHGHWALLWLRGTYSDFFVYDLDVVGIVDPAPGYTPPVLPARAPRPGYHVRDQSNAAGDFDADGRSDLFLYGPGSVEDSEVHFLANGRRRSIHRPTPTTASARPVVGDFDGNGRDDVLFYTPGSAPDPLRMYRGAGNYDATTRAVTGTGYRPFTGDFNGDGLEDIFWYAPGSGPDSIWFATGGGGYRSAASTVRGDYRPAVSDLDGDGADDIVWHGPGAAPDRIWLGAREGPFRQRAMAAGGSYLPFGGDFNGDGLGDVLWYGPGSGPDSIWFSTADGGFRSVPTAVHGRYDPAVGDFDGDHADDIAWYAPAAGNSVDFWYGGSRFPTVR